MLAAGFGCAVLASVSWGGGEGQPQPVSAATLPTASTPPASSPASAAPAHLPGRAISPTSTPSSAHASASTTNSDAIKAEDLKKLALVKNLNLEPGLLDQRVRLSGRAPDAPLSAPPSEPTLTRRDFLRLKDRMEAKENWMFVDPQKIDQDREKSAQDDAFKDKWELKQDLKKREWWEYGSKSASSASSLSSSATARELSDPSQMDDATRAQVARKLREEDAKSRETLSSTRRTGSGSDSLGSTHQYSALSMKELFQPGNDAKTGRSSELGLSELFGNNARNTERDSIALRRQEFRDFLNVSRVPKPPTPAESAPSPLAPNAIGGAFSDPMQSSLRPVLGGREGMGPGLNPALDTARGAAGFGNYYDMNRPGPSGPQGNSSQAYRSLESSRNLITPAMMEPPKRRF